MGDHNERAPAPTSTGGFYRIRVRGVVEETWAKMLGGLMATPAEESVEGNAVTTLTGWLPDQAALFGVLAALYNNRLAILSVDCAEDEAGTQGRRAG